MYASKSRTLPKFIELATGSLKDKIHLLDHESQQLLVEKLFEYLSQETEVECNEAIPFLLSLLTSSARGQLAGLTQMKKTLLEKGIS